MWPENPTSTTSCTEYLCSPYGKGQVFQIYTPKYQLPQKLQGSGLELWSDKPFFFFRLKKPEEYRQPSWCWLAGCLCRRLPSMYERLWKGLSYFTVIVWCFLDVCWWPAINYDKSRSYAAFHYARCRRLSKLCRFTMHGLSVTLVDYALVFTTNMEKFVCNFRCMNDSSFNPEQNSSHGH